MLRYITNKTMSSKQSLKKASTQLEETQTKKYVSLQNKIESNDKQTKNEKSTHCYLKEDKCWFLVWGLRSVLAEFLSSRQLLEE